MALLFHEDKDYFPEARKIGFARYRQVLERDWKQFFMVGLLTLGFMLPFAAGVGMSILTSSVLVLLGACVIGGAIAGVGLAGMYDVILRGLRDCRDHWWYSYKKAFLQNFRSAVLPGILQCLFIGFVVFSGALMWWSQAPISYGTVAIICASSILCTMVFTVWWSQVVLFTQSHMIQLKNCVLFCIKYFWRTLGAAVLQVVWWMIAFLFMPWTAFLMPILGVWFILFVTIFLIYRSLDNAFRIEEQIEEKFPEQFDPERSDPGQSDPGYSDFEQSDSGQSGSGQFNFEQFAPGPPDLNRLRQSDKEENG